MSDMFVSIVIPVFHNWESLAQCLAALETQTYPGDMFEVIVVNNDPEDTSFRLEQRDKVRVVSESKTGSYAARNRGIAESQGQLLGFCDADCIPSPGWIANAVGFLERNPSCRRLAGRIELIYADKQNLSYAELYEKVFAFKQETYAQNGASATANMFAYRHVFDDVGFFNDALLSGGDLEWGMRASTAGHTIGYCPEALVLHPARKSIKDLIKKARRVCSGYIHLYDAKIRNNPLHGLYHGLSMLKPPLRAGTMIVGSNGIPARKKVVLYLIEYMLKLVQLWEFTLLQMGIGKPKRG